MKGNMEYGRGLHYLFDNNLTLPRSRPSSPSGIGNVCGIIIGALLEGDGSGAPGRAKGWTAAKTAEGAGGMGGIRMTRRPRRQFST